MLQFNLVYLLVTSDMALEQNKKRYVLGGVAQYVRFAQWSTTPDPVFCVNRQLQVYMTSNLADDDTCDVLHTIQCLSDQGYSGELARSEHIESTTYPI